MKKGIMLAVWAGCVLVMAGCGGKTPDSAKEQIVPGTYEMQHEEEVLFAPSVSLKEDQSFTFCSSLLSSYLIMGTYEEQDDGTLRLLTDDEKYQYFFTIDGESLIFDGERSDIPFTFEGELPVEDGARFVLIDEEE